MTDYIKLKWDNRLPEELHNRWIQLFEQIFLIDEIVFNRAVTPKNRTNDKPIKITFSDGSTQAFSAVTYIRWKLQDGSFWTTILMAKSRVAPLKKCLSLVSN